VETGKNGRLAGRRILITGAGSGIGKATAELFAAEGATLALVDVVVESVKAVASKLDAHAFTLDVTKEADVRATMAAANEALGGLDGIANVAGIGRPAKLADLTLADWNFVLGVNLTGPFLICREALPYLSRNERATIVNVASASALLPIGTSLGSYVASKAGLVALSKTLAFELAPKIRVNCVCPGSVDTPILPQSLRESGNDPERSPYALKRIADPSEIAAGILFATSWESSYMTGSTLSVDGGRSYH
jgi:NAD(P)-dependent dehydrogenase (short-subunit alcohol dehydrogenase family)